ncbi:transglutaminase domain-containing protein [Hungatella hathewayi]|uniref:transglutaminase domain-containing protein n=1 Tax=Hungatella hathewayi TaxID=154046 RepID=UPI00033EA8AF|nr:transglutaminase domain-containing protein [Hungatella hathewayi]CCZ62076.1 gLUG domain-containing protein family protein [Hungatella hathewayi CAG:224]
MKKRFKRYLAMLLCLALIIPHVNPQLTAFADTAAISNGLQKTDDDFSTVSIGYTSASPSEATPAEADKNSDKDGDKSDENLDSNNPAASILSIDQLGKNAKATLSNAVYYLEDVLNTADEIDLFYGSQLRTSEAVIYHMIESYLEYAEEVSLGGPAYFFDWTKSISVSFDDLDYEEYSDFAIDVQHELEIYEYMASEAYSMDHPEYDLTSLKIKNEPYYTDSATEKEGKTVYSGRIRLDITFSFRGATRPTFVIDRYNELMEVLPSIPVSGNSRYNRVKKIYDYLCSNVSYSTDKEDWLINTAYGAIVKKKANCNGYARAFKVLCDYYDIPSLIIAGGESGDCIGNTVEYYEDSLRQHLWNYVQMEDGEWYAAAVDADARNLSDDYFLIGSKTVINEDLYTFADVRRPSTAFAWHMNSFENTGMTAHELLYPELSEEAYDNFSGEVTIENVALYSEEENLSSQIDALDYAAGNFYCNYGKNIDVENPETSAYKDQCFLHFTVETDAKIEFPENVNVTVTLPDGFSFSRDTIENERTYHFSSHSQNREIWDEISFMYTEIIPRFNEANIQYTIETEQEVLDKGRKTFVSINVYSSLDRITLELGEGEVAYSEWNTGMFFGNSSDYNDDLALFSAYMSDMMECVNKDQLRQRIKKNLTALGFSKIQYSGKGTIWQEEYVFATKKVIYNGTVKTILLSAIQGSDVSFTTLQSYYDWIGNIWYFGGKEHANIERCMDNHLQELASYRDKANFINSDIRILVTGHSRGGGIANRVAEKINSTYGKGKPIELLYCYTFAALNVIAKDDEELDKNSNIFNLVNYADIVPFIPGYNLGKYGQSGVFNTLDNKSIDIIGALRQASCIKPIYIAPTIYNWLYNLKLKNDVFAQHKMSVYENAVKKYSYEELNWDFDNLGKRIDSIYNNGLLVQMFTNFIDKIEVNLESTFVKLSNTLINTNNQVRHLVECPVDIDIINSNGDVVCKIINDQIIFVEADDLSIIISDDKKEILYPVTAEYQLQIKGYDTGTMDYKLIITDETGMDKVLYKFSDLQVIKDQLVMNVNADEKDPTFISGSSDVMNPHEIIDSEEFEYVTVQLDTNIETVSSSGKNDYVKGDFVWAYTVSDSDEKFIGWFDQAGKLVSYDRFYVFPAQEDVHYTARFLSSEESYCDIYGHTVQTEKGWPSTCISHGMSDWSYCSVCNTIISDMEELPLADHTLVISEAVAPTTTTTGLTEGIWCSVCGLTIKEQQFIPKLDDSDEPSEDAGEIEGGSSGSGGGSSSGGGSHLGGGGSSSGGGSHSGGGGSSSGGGSATGGSGKGPGGTGTSSLPDYVVKGTWTQLADLNWTFTDSNGILYTNRWAAIENPYANPALGQSAFDWFYFDTNGYMVSGWHQDGEDLFYLNQNSDGTRGKMTTGWCWIPDQNGIQKCYYFNPNSDGTRGKLIRNSVIDGNTVDANGEWIVNGIVQIK